MFSPRILHTHVTLNILNTNLLFFFIIIYVPKHASTNNYHKLILHKFKLNPLRNTKQIQYIVSRYKYTNIS